VEETDQQQVRRRPLLFQRRLLVDKKMQLAIISYSMIVALITIFFMGVFITILQTVSVDATSGGSQLRYFSYLAAMWLIAMLVLTFLGIYVTNKAAGPVYRLRKNMQSIAAGGAVENVAFRKDDFFLDLAEDYNRVLERLRKAETR
jgi:signal transduction histidine kinase